VSLPDCKPIAVKLTLQCKISKIPWAFHNTVVLILGVNKLMHVLFFLKNPIIELCLCEVPWLWGSRKCNDRHQSICNAILLYTQVQLPFLSTFAINYIVKVLILERHRLHRTFIDLDLKYHKFTVWLATCGIWVPWCMIGMELQEVRIVTVALT